MKQHLSTYIVHYASFIAGICAIIAAADPKVLGPEGASIVGAGAAGVAIAHALGIKPAQLAKGAAALLLAGVLCLHLQGCATIAKIDTAVSSPAAQPYLTAAADVAVATAEQKGISAAQIASIATQALAADQGTSASLAAVAGVVNTELAKLNLPAQDLAAAQVLELALSAAIDAQIGSNATLAQTQGAVADLLEAIITATGTSGVAPGGVTPPTSDATTVPVPAPAATPAARAAALATVVSPPVLGAAASAVLVACLTTFTHLSVAAPTAAGITVLFTFANAYFGW